MNASASVASSESYGIRNVFRLPSSPVAAKGLITPNSGTIARPSKLFFANGQAMNTYAVYLHLYDMAVAPTVGTSVPKMTLAFSSLNYWNGTTAVSSPSPNAYDFEDVGIDFLTGIAYAITAGPTDADNTAILAGDLVALNIGWM